VRASGAPNPPDLVDDERDHARGPLNHSPRNAGSEFAAQQDGVRPSAVSTNSAVSPPVRMRASGEWR